MMTETKRVLLRRTAYTPEGTPGAIYVREPGEFERWQWVTLCFERPWLSNQKNVSCVGQIAHGELVWHDSPRFGRCLKVEAAMGDRTNILLHSSNYQCQTRGCIIPVTSLQLFTKPGIEGWGGWKSRQALRKLEALLPDDGTRYRFDIEGPPS